MNHLDLFSGIGGFALAAQRIWGEAHNIVAFCEIDEFCQKVLNKHWPHVPIISDIREVTYERIMADTDCERTIRQTQDKTYGENGKKVQPDRIHSAPGIDACRNGCPKRNGKATPTTIDLLTGGFPCQPYSQAGKQRGAEDDRHLWPQMLRVIREVRPTWVIGENVAGIINMELDTVLSDLEDSDYEVQSFLIPACGVDAPHRRDRVWIVGHSKQHGHFATKNRRGFRKESLQRRPCQPQSEKKESFREFKGTSNERWKANSETSSKDVADTQRKGLEIGEGKAATAIQRVEQHGREDAQHPYQNGCHKKRQGVTEARSNGIVRAARWLAEPGLGKCNDGLPPEMDGGGIDAENKKERPSKVLSELCKTDTKKKIQRAHGRQERIPEAKILRSGLHGEGLCQKHAILFGAIETSEKIPWKLLRDLWGYIHDSSASYRWESEQQLKRKYPEFMRQLSQYPPPPCQACWSDGSWEDGLPRVAKGITNRVDRLKSLGNAIVPQCVMPVMQAIKEIEENGGVKWEWRND